MRRSLGLHRPFLRAGSCIAVDHGHASLPRDRLSAEGALRRPQHLVGPAVPQLCFEHVQRPGLQKQLQHPAILVLVIRSRVAFGLQAHDRAGEEAQPRHKHPGKLLVVHVRENRAVLAEVKCLAGEALISSIDFGSAATQTYVRFQQGGLHLGKQRQNLVALDASTLVRPAIWRHSDLAVSQDDAVPVVSHIPTSPEHFVHSKSCTAADASTCDASASGTRSRRRKRQALPTLLRRRICIRPVADFRARRGDGETADDRYEIGRRRGLGASRCPVTARQGVGIKNRRRASAKR
eukprot:scaffold1023_cov313-Pinguiococcus_pyrenoidosus.AAC.28